MHTIQQALATVSLAIIENELLIYTGSKGYFKAVADSNSMHLFVSFSV